MVAMAKQTDERPNNAENFRGQLERARLAFERATRSSDPIANAALFEQMLFECARARRIAKDDPASLKDVGLNPEEILIATANVARVRNTIEHWADPKKPRPLKDHKHVLPSGLKIAVDETSTIVVRSDRATYKGDVDLYELYEFIVAQLTRLRR